MSGEAQAPVEVELEAIRVILEALERLDNEGKHRVLRYFVSRYLLRWV